MAFGLSPSIYPGRYFATSEILALVAMIALRYHIAPADQVWHAPPRMNSATTSNMGPVEGKPPITAKRDESIKGSHGSSDSLKAKGSCFGCGLKPGAQRLTHWARILHTEPRIRCV
jgi:hypothetical protein